MLCNQVSESHVVLDAEDPKKHGGQRDGGQRASWKCSSIADHWLWPYQIYHRLTIAVGTEPDVATEHIAVEADASMSMDAIVMELSAHLIDDARDVINAAQIILKGSQMDIRSVCKLWGCAAQSSVA